MKISALSATSLLARPLLLATVLAVGPAALHAQTLYGPTPYLSEADSPFLGSVCIEDFEDATFLQPGVTCDNGGVVSVIYGSGANDSVDADDGVIDGSGLDGDDWFSYGGPVTFSFDAAIMGGLPTQVGIVWTDGAGYTTFEAFDRFGISLGVIGPVLIADGYYNGTTADDHFFGIDYAGGVGSITIACGGSQEVDHLQFSCPQGQATETVRLGTPPNPDALRPGLTSGPVLRRSWDPWVDHTTFHPTASVDMLAVSSAPFEYASIWGTLLIDVTRNLVIEVSPAGTPFSVRIPDTYSYVGLQVYAQAVSLPPYEMTNALDLVLGTY